jgi:phosphatidylglycerol:prolipoprotein diacylglycerol transferase
MASSIPSAVTMPGATFSSAYGWLMLIGIAVSLVLWRRLARKDSRLIIIYLAALLGAFFGAKIVYLASEGWLHWNDENRWLGMATGKSILGALFGGYAGVELAKWAVSYSTPTGDLFALVVPLGIMFGRVGCMLQGCCLGQVCKSSWFTVRDAEGVNRWPAAQLEFIFNLLALASLAFLRGRGIARHQLFHIYLIAYGVFRFAHEMFRDTPRLFLGLSGYQIAALLVAFFGSVAFVIRSRQQLTSQPVPSPS